MDTTDKIRLRILAEIENGAPDAPTAVARATERSLKDATDLGWPEHTKVGLIAAYVAAGMDLVVEGLARIA